VPRPLGEALQASDKMVLAAFNILRAENGDGKKRFA
jgi:hypothetical protein